MASNILINKLIVVGRKKDYSVNFNPGVNIIYGDSATGKSSILNLIDYLLGSKKFKSYPEIESTGRYAVLDVTLNEDRYTIKRDLFNPKRLIEVYPCAHDKINEHAVTKYLPTYNHDTQYPDAGFFSDFLLDALSFSKIKLKESPSKDTSRQVRLSFRDLFKYCYINQDVLGSEKFLKSDNWALQAKNKEVFKYIFNALDSNISNLEGLISEQSNEKNKLDKIYKTISEFLRDAEFGTLMALDDEIESLDIEIIKIEKYISQLNLSQSVDPEIYQAIKTELANLAMERRTVIEDMQEQQLKIERFTRLKNDYLNDINKYQASIFSKNIIGSNEPEIELCPVCDNTLEITAAKDKFELFTDEKITSEISILKRRARETESIASKTKQDWELNRIKLNNIEESEKEAHRLQEKNTTVSPNVAERDMFTSKLGELQQKRKELISRLKVRNKHSSISKSKKSLEKSIEKLQKQLIELQKHTPTMTEVLEDLADNLQDYLEFVRIKSPKGISFDEKTFYPKVRDIEYSDITSGGLRTIVGIGYMCSLIEAALKTSINYPSFLMIDTVGKYLGKTKEQNYKEASNLNADRNEAVSDPTKYKNIYDFIINLAEKYEEKNRICQFILVDNDVPEHIVDELKGFIVAHYSSERLNGLPVGFIDDADSYN
ncbi:hypothetical protein [Shewanella algae]|uniref:hypothetical protein n=1 Tax=Shewanella algae TaxID=38313 RepID=UPI003005F575